MRSILFLTCISAASFCTPPVTIYGAAEMQGRRPSMEDAHYVEIAKKYAFVGLYDGHGGRGVADFAANKLHTYCDLTKHKNVGEIVTALGEGFLATHASLGDPLENRNLAINANQQGCTAIVAFIRKKQLFVANTGDSRALLCRAGNAIALSVDHKPNRPDEKKRIQELGGKIIYEWAGGRVEISNASLAISRALGDKDFHPYVIPHPEIHYKPLVSDDEFLILACDGVWDVLDNQPAVDIVREALKNNADDFTLAAEALMHAAYKKGSNDNISVIVVGLEQFNK